MAKSKIITHAEIAEPGAISEHLGKEFEDLVAYLPAVESAIAKTAKNISSSLKSLRIEGATIEDLKKINAVTEQATQLTIAHSKVQKAKIDLTNQQLAQQKLDKDLKRDSINLLKAEITEMNKSVGTLQRIEAANTRLRLERKQLNAETDDGKKRLREINSELDRNNKYIIDNSDKLKQQKLNVGNYTESIRRAFEGTGALGDAINKYLNIVTLLTDKLTLLTGAQEATAVATKGTTVALEGETVATESATVATTGLSEALEFLEANPLVGVIAGLVAAGAVLYENVTATQAGRDSFESYTKALYAAAKAQLLQIVTLGQYGGNADKVAIITKIMVDQEHELALARIESTTALAKLNAEAEEARIASSEEGKTTAERIKLLGEYDSKIHEQFDIKKKLAEREVVIAKANVEKFKLLGDAQNRDAKEQLQNALAQQDVLTAEQDQHLKRSTLMRTGLIKKYNDDILKLRQDAAKEEIELIDTEDEDKIVHVLKQLEKDKKLNDLETKQAVENLKNQQAELGAIDAQGIDHTKEFQREILDLKKLGKAKEKELAEKASADIDKINEELFNKEAERLKKISDLNAKQAEKDFKITTAQLEEQQSKELEIIEENYAKQKDHSVKAENDKQKAILAVKIKYLELEKLRNEDDLEAQAKIQKQINDLKAAYALGSGKLDDKLAAERLKEAQKIEEEITSGIQEGLQKRSELQQQADQRDIDFHSRMLEVQAKLAAAGQKNILAEEIAASTRAEEKKLQDAKRAAKIQENIELVKVFSDTLNQALEKNQPFFKAFSEAIGATGIVKTIFAKFFSGSAYEGVEDTGSVAGTLDDKGGKAWILHPNERVVPKKLNEQLEGISNEELVNSALAFQNIYKPQFEAANVSSTIVRTHNHDAVMTMTLSRKIDELRQEIKGKPVEKINLGKLGEWTQEIEQNGLKNIIHHRKSLRRPSLRRNG